MISKIIVNILPKLPQKFVWLFSKKYIVGKTLEESLVVINKLNEQGYLVTIDLLGEFIDDMSEAYKTTETYLKIIDIFKRDNIKGGISIKPTFFGLLLDRDKCFENINKVVQKAHEKRIFVRIDMEDSQCTEMEIEMYEKLHTAYPNTVGLVLQAYLFRTVNDIDRLNKVHTNENPVNIRLCKGIYVEDASISYKKYEDINNNYMMLLNKMLDLKFYVGIATHDKKLVEAAYKLIKEKGLQKTDYEFQMLYGVEPKLRRQTHMLKHNIRIYLPYGQDWFGYSVRRLKENPKIAMHIMKSIFQY